MYGGKKKKTRQKKVTDPLGQPSRWDLERDGLSSSLIALFLQCPEQFRLEVCSGYKPISEPIYFAFGQCFHWMLQRAYAKSAPPRNLWIKTNLKKYHIEWLAWAVAPSQKRLEQQELVYGLVSIVLPEYFMRWAGDWPGLDYPTKHAITRPDGWLSLESSRTVHLEIATDRGRLLHVPIRIKTDGVFESSRGGTRYNMDHKCQSVIMEDDILAAMPSDFQQLLYCWALTKAGIKRVKGCQKNIIRRPANRRKQNESLVDFLSRIAEGINKKTWDYYFMRHELEFSKGGLAEFETKVLVPVVRLIWMWWTGKIDHWQNPTNLITKYGRVPTFDLIVNGNTRNMVKKTGDVFEYHESLA